MKLELKPWRIEDAEIIACSFGTVEQGGGLAIVDGDSLLGGDIVACPGEHLEVVLRTDEGKELTVAGSSILVGQKSAIAVVLKESTALREVDFIVHRIVRSTELRQLCPCGKRADDEQQE